MSIWFAIPSARPIQEAKPCFDAWKAIGCKVAATRKDPADCQRLGLDLCVSLPKYLGWPTHCNLLAKQIVNEIDPECTIVAAGGDDCYPDPNFPAERVEREFIEHFGGTLGVMQPTGGEPWSAGIIDGRRVQERIAWAPWMGREWIKRAYMGAGPMWPEYHHFYADEHLQLTAERLGLFWQRPDIAEEHLNWKANRQPPTFRPPHLKEAATLWPHDKDIFERTKRPDWPGAALLPESALK